MRAYMNRIVDRRDLNANVVEMRVDAPEIARVAEAGQFVILRVEPGGERIPLTIAEYDRDCGLVTLIFQTVGATTMRLGALMPGQFICDMVGPLGNPTDATGVRAAIVVGGGAGCAIALPVARKLAALGADVRAIIGFRDKSLIILEDEFRAACRETVLMTDDGSAGTKGLVTDALERMIGDGAKCDRAFAFGPAVMMKSVCALTKRRGIKTTVSMAPIMIDGTGMCGGCRLTVGGKTKFACVDGPEFDGWEVDFDEVIARAGMYREEERARRDETCRLLRGAKAE